MSGKKTITMLAAFVLLALPAWADWDLGDGHKMHFPQLPDRTANGLDVLAGPFTNTEVTYEKFLADDWQCSASGPVTDIHFWGSYASDVIPANIPPDQAYFSLVIYDNIPEGTGGQEYSRPGEPLWDRYVQPSQVRIDGNSAQQRFYDPNSGGFIGEPHQEVWQFNFDIPLDDAFRQEEGKIYWLGLHHTFDLDGSGTVDGIDRDLLVESPFAFGWKSSDRNRYPAPYTGGHFEDDAVWVDVDSLTSASPHIVPPAGTGWQELRYPLGNEYEGQSMDLSFVITTIPEPTSLVLLGLGILGTLLQMRKLT